MKNPAFAVCAVIAYEVVFVTVGTERFFETFFAVVAGGSVKAVSTTERFFETVVAAFAERFLKAFCATLGFFEAVRSTVGLFKAFCTAACASGSVETVVAALTERFFETVSTPARASRSVFVAVVAAFFAAIGVFLLAEIGFETTFVAVVLKRTVARPAV